MSSNCWKIRPSSEDVAQGVPRSGANAAPAEKYRRHFPPAGQNPGRVLDIGCGQGALLDEIREKLGVEVIGFDLRPAPAGSSIPILTGNAAVDPLPEADVAISICLAHHLSEEDVVSTSAMYRDPAAG